MRIDIDGIVQSIRDIIAQPAAHQQQAVLLLAFAVVFFVMIGILVVVGVALMSGRGSEPQVPRPEKPKRELTPDQVEALKRRRTVTGRLLAGIVALALVAAYVVSSTNTYCVSCHRDVAFAKASPHASAPCASCHEDGGAAGIPGDVTLRVRDIARRAGLAADASTAPTPPSRCLACHERIASGVVTDPAKGVRMRHSDPLAAGMSCRDCHADAGHAQAPASVTMSVCLRCHDGRQASAKCSTCHVGDPAQAAVAQQTFGNVHLGPATDCGGCHAQKTCDACHGLRMPHTAVFEAYDHARTAAFDGKQVCRRCHSDGFCTKCHIKFTVGGHDANWKTEHQTFPAGSFCSCHQQKMPPGLQNRPFCLTCHPSLKP